MTQTVTIDGNRIDTRCPTTNQTCFTLERLAGMWVAADAASHGNEATIASKLPELTDVLEEAQTRPEQHRCEPVCQATAALLIYLETNTFKPSQES